MTGPDSGPPSLRFIRNHLYKLIKITIFTQFFSLQTVFTIYRVHKASKLSSSFIHPLIVPSESPHTRDKLAFDSPLFTWSIIFNFSATEYGFHFCDILTWVYDSDWNCIWSSPYFKNWSQAERFSTLVEVQYKTLLFLCTVILPGMQRSVVTHGSDSEHYNAEALFAEYF